MTPEQLAAAFIAQAQERTRGTFIEQLGVRLIEVSEAQAVAEMDFTPALQQLTGVFHAGALITLADTTATLATLYWSGDRPGEPTSRFPFTIQLNTNIVRNTNHGTVRATARPIHRGRTTTVVETRLIDAEQRLLLVVTTTHLFISNSA